MRGFVVGVLFAMGIIAWTLELAFYTTHKSWWPRETPNGPFEELVLRVWDVYVFFDPIFDQPPLWLKVMCWIEVLVFGPLYFISAYALKSRAPWARSVVLPFAGALLYSTIVYFALELGSERVPGTNDLVVLVVNLPWTLLPIVLFFVV
jgi:hypothetical protein